MNTEDKSSKPPVLSSDGVYAPVPEHLRPWPSIHPLIWAGVIVCAGTLLMVILALVVKNSDAYKQAGVRLEEKEDAASGQEFADHFIEKYQIDDSATVTTSLVATATIEFYATERLKRGISQASVMPALDELRRFQALNELPEEHFRIAWFRPDGGGVEMRVELSKAMAVTFQNLDHQTKSLILAGALPPKSETFWRLMPPDADLLVTASCSNHLGGVIVAQEAFTPR